MWEGSTCYYGAVEQDAVSTIYQIFFEVGWGLRHAFVILCGRMIQAGYDPESEYLQYDTCPWNYRLHNLAEYTGNNQEFI
jgi:hypothetical protein